MGLTFFPGTGEYTASPGASYTTANTVSPSAGNMVAVLLDVGCSATETLTVKDSLGNTYSHGTAWSENLSIKTYNLIYTYTYSSAPGAITFTVTSSPAVSSLLIRPIVITGQAADQSTADVEIGFSSSSSSTCEISVTPTVIGSYYVVVGGATGVTSATANGNTLTYTSHATSGTVTHLIGRSGSSGSLTAKTLGWTLSPSSSQGYAIAALEILPVVVSYNGAITSNATAQASFGGKKTGFTHQAPAATAQASFGGKKTGLGQLAPAATTEITAGAKKTRFAHPTIAASAQTVLGGTRTIFTPLASGISTTVTAGGFPASAGAVTAAVTAQAEPVPSASSALAVTATGRVMVVSSPPAMIAAATADMQAASIAALTAAVAAEVTSAAAAYSGIQAAATAQTAFTGMRGQFRAVTAEAGASLTAAGKKTAKGAVTSGAAAQARFARTRGQPGNLIAAVSSAFQVAETKTAQGAVTAVAAAQALFDGLKTRPGSLAAEAGASLTAAGTKSAGGAVTAVAAAQALTGAVDARFGAVIAGVSARLSAAGAKGFPALASGITASLSASAGKLVHGFFTAVITAALKRIIPVRFPLSLGGAVTVLASTGVPEADTGGTVSLTAYGGGSTVAAVSGTAVESNALLAGAFSQGDHGGAVLAAVYGGGTTVITASGTAVESNALLSAVPVQADSGGTAVESNSIFGGGTAVSVTADGTAAESNALLAAAIYQTDQGGTIALADLGGGAVGWAMQNVNLNFAEFNDITLSVTITSNGTALNLTGYTVNMLLKPSAGIVDTDGSVVTLSSAGDSPAITITNASSGACSVAVPRTDVQNQTLSFYRIDAVDGSGNINTAIYGNITYTAL